MISFLITMKALTEQTIEAKNHGKFAVNGLLICADCGSTNTRLLNNGIKCNECRSFRISQNYYHLTYLPQIILSSTGRETCKT